MKSDEVAVVLRWGRLVGGIPALQQHGPGLLFAFPRPVDEVVRVQVKHVWEVPVTTLAAGEYSAQSSAAPRGPVPQAEGEDEDAEPGEATANAATLDPLTQGYALTGDQNIVHVEMVARYRVRDPAEWAFYGPKAEDVLRVEVTAAMVRSLGEMGVDRVLSDGRKDLIATATRRAQAGLDAAHSGLELSSLELTRLEPPVASGRRLRCRAKRLHRRGNKKKDAQAYAENIIPRPRPQRTPCCRLPVAPAPTTWPRRMAMPGRFGRLIGNIVPTLELFASASTGMPWSRRFRNASKVRWVPPPVGGTYQGCASRLGHPVAEINPPASAARREIVWNE